MPASHDLSHLRIGLVGPLPPLRGGMSLYMQRLADRLADRGARVVAMSTTDGTEADPRVQVVKVPPGRIRAAVCSQIAWNEGLDLLHVHSFGAFWKEMLPFAAVQQATGLPVVVSQHSLIQELHTFSARDQRMLALTCGALARVATSGPTVRDKLLQLGVAPHKLTAVVPFLVPQTHDLSVQTWPADIDAVRKRSGPLVVAGTGRLVASGGRDLYGLDQFVAAARKVLTHRPDAGFVYLIGADGAPDLLKASRQFVVDHQLQHAVCIHVGDLPGPLMWQAGDVFVRPTIDDGDAVSVREAMLLGVPTVASDAVGRPPGCWTYRSGDTSDLARTLLSIFSDLEGARRTTAANRPAEGFDAVVEIYQEVLAAGGVRSRLRSGLQHGPLGRAVGVKS